MNRVSVISAVILAAMFTLCGCSPSYPESYDNGGEGGAVRPNDRNLDSVLIQLSLSDPLYSVETRGVGSFGPWTRDSVHWKNADMRVYAFSTYNGIEGGADYSRDSLCLLDDHEAHIVDEFGHLWLYSPDGSHAWRYYRKTQPNTRYKFFMYHADDAVVGSPLYSGNTLSRHILLDGSQDLIHAFAYPTETQSAEAAAMLKMKETDAACYLYSYRAALSGLNPILHVQHLLCQMDVCVIGQPVNTDEGKYKYLYQMMAVDNIGFTAAQGGTLLIANDAWERDTYLSDLDAGNVFRPDDTQREHKCLLRSNPMSSNVWTRLYNKDVDFDAVRRQMTEAGWIGESSVYYHLNGRSGVQDTLTARPLLLPPQKEYILTIGGCWADIDKDGTCRIQRLPVNPIRIASMDGKGFRRGHHYTLILTMYGPQKIGLGGLLDEWIEDGELHVNTLNLQPL